MFQDLISRIQCTRVQYRDSNLVETNEDSTSDRVGDFFAGLLDLESGIELSLMSSNSSNLNETVVVEDRVGSEVDLLSVVVDEVEDVTDEELPEEEENQQKVSLNVLIWGSIDFFEKWLFFSNVSNDTNVDIIFQSGSKTIYTAYIKSDWNRERAFATDSILNWQYIHQN